MLDITAYHEHANQTTMKYYPTPTRMAVIKNTIRSAGEIGAFVHCFVPITSGNIK